MARNDIRGMRELERLIRRLGRLPQRHVTKAARSGARIAQKAAKRNAPEDQGELRRGIILKGERRVKIGKKVYDIIMDPSKNDVFVKISKEGKRSYYPASQEYGFFAVNGRYIPGFRYLRKSVDNNKREIEEKIVDVMGKEIDKELSRG